jgi:SIR2-like domain
MQELAFDDAVAIALDSLLNDRLAVLCGAGLSMDPPSSLPSAAALASAAKETYDAQYGGTRPPLPAGIEDQAEYFFKRGELATVYFRSLIDFNAFAGPPNPGHFGVADLLLTRGIQTAVTTNVDVLIETAGQLLFGQIGAGIDGATVATLPPDRAPLLKLHGCRTRDPDNMVWASGQLAVEPVASRIASIDQWLRGRLLDRDLIIVGYWTDWDYLNDVLAATLGAARPARVIVVNPADGATFQDKAPALYSLGQRATGQFNHVARSGSEFLDALRLEFSKSFVRRVLHAGANEFFAQTGAHPSAVLTEPPPLTNDILWSVRRDLEGRMPLEPARERNPANEPLLGLTILQLRAIGAVADGSYWLLNGRRIRVLRASNQPLHRIQAAFEREMAPTVAPDIVVAVGAESQALPANIARVGTAPTITRGNASRWMSRPEAVQELRL